MTDDKDILLAVKYANKLMFRILGTEPSIPENNLGKFHNECVKPALEIALNAHKRGGVTRGQYEQLEQLDSKATSLV